MGAASPRPRYPPSSISTSTLRRESEAPRAMRKVRRSLRSSGRCLRTITPFHYPDIDRRGTPSDHVSMTALLVLALLAAPADTVVVGTLGDPLSLEPHRATDLLSAAIVANVCETLVRYRADGTRPEASLATTWANVNGRVWTFTLREGVRFHDGVPLDADAVVANLDALRRSRGFPGQAHRIGPRVVTITLDRPNAALLATLSQPFFSLQSPRELQRGATGRPVGTGPFRLLSAQPGLVELIPNWSYWGGPPRLGGILFRRYRDEESLAAALLSGEVDVSSAVGFQRLPRLRASPDI